MELLEIREIARAMGINTKGMGKAEAVRAVQRAVGEIDCFGSAAEEECDQEDCMWREDCFAEAMVAEKAG